MKRLKRISTPSNELSADVFSLRFQVPFHVRQKAYRRLAVRRRKKLKGDSPDTV